MIFLDLCSDSFFSARFARTWPSFLFVVLVVVYFVLSRLLYIAFSAN